jgi:hypothetical protein
MAANTVYKCDGEVKSLQRDLANVEAGRQISFTGLCRGVGFLLETSRYRE